MTINCSFIIINFVFQFIYFVIIFNRDLQHFNRQLNNLANIFKNIIFLYQIISLISLKYFLWLLIFSQAPLAFDAAIWLFVCILVITLTFMHLIVFLLTIFYIIRKWLFFLLWLDFKKKTNKFLCNNCLNKLFVQFLLVCVFCKYSQFLSIKFKLCKIFNYF